MGYRAPAFPSIWKKTLEISGPGQSMKVPELIFKSSVTVGNSSHYSFDNVSVMSILTNM